MGNNIQEALKRDLDMGKASLYTRMVVNMMEAGCKGNNQVKDTILM